MPEPRLLNCYEVSKRLNCSAAHVRQLLAVGRLKGINIGIGGRRTNWRVTEEALAEFIKNAAQEAAPPFRVPGASAR